MINLPYFDTARNVQDLPRSGQPSSTRQLRIHANENSTYRIIINTKVDNTSSVYPDFDRLFRSVRRCGLEFRWVGSEYTGFAERSVEWGHHHDSCRQF